MTNAAGKIWLVGAGPGDPGLLTVKGAALLAQADVVVYDFLANPRLLDHAPAAQKIYVGKKAASHSFSQDEINAQLVSLGRAGKKVVRLKGGDPFVFGRGGEECLALKEAGIEFEVVPGITAAIGGPAYAGIPVTHRDFNSSFTFITGHEKEEEYKDQQARSREAASGSSDVDWAVIAKLPCVAFYMGVKSLPRICAKLMEHGLDPATPAATIRWGTKPEQQTIVATVATLAAEVAKVGMRPPAMTIVGKVVSLHQQLNWFERRPLFGKTIVVTRTRSQASELSAKLEELGANVIEAPTIEVKPVADLSSVDRLLRQLANVKPAPAEGYALGDPTHDRLADWFIFTSANGVQVVRDRLKAVGYDTRALSAIRFAVIGEATAQAVRDLFSVEPDCIAPQAVAESLSDELIAKHSVAGCSFAYFQAEIVRPVLTERLRAAAAAVLELPVYQTCQPESLPPELLAALKAKQVHAVTFTSSSTARNFAALLGDDYRQVLQGVHIASIGPITSQTLRDLGLPPTVEAKTFHLDGLVDALLP